MKGNTIEINVNKLRDPFVLSENGVYYMYGTMDQVGRAIKT